MSLYIGTNLKLMAKRLDTVRSGNRKAALSKAAKESKVEVVSLRDKPITE